MMDIQLNSTTSRLPIGQAKISLKFHNGEDEKIFKIVIVTLDPLLISKKAH
jgi:hypothetical protein